MEFKLVGHDNLRDLKQLSYAFFKNADGEIHSELKSDEIITKIIYNGELHTNKMCFTEKNDFKRSLYNCAMQIENFDVPWGILTGINPSKLVGENYDKTEFMKKYYVSNERADFAKSVYDFTNNVKVDKNDISVYIGIPFCKTKCSYCSFVGNSISSANKHKKAYVDCLLREIKTVANLIKNRYLRAIYIGGGTPTALETEDFKRLLQAVDENFSKEFLIEYTVEAGRADTICDEKLELLEKFNVQRISINPQVFDDDILQNIGRNHTSKDVIEIFKKAKKMNFKAINMDLIYGLGGDFAKTVDMALSLDPENITLHTLAIKKGSKLDLDYDTTVSDIGYFYEKVQKNYEPYYMYRQQYLIRPYENIGFHKPNSACLYNVYMMENLMDIVAIGSGATSKIGGESFFNNKYPADYINNIEKVLKTKEKILNKEKNDAF